MDESRRRFGKLAIGGAASSLLLARGLPATGGDSRELSVSGIKIGHRMNPNPTEEDLDFFKQCGIEYVTIWTSVDMANFDYFIKTRRLLESRGLQLWNIGILDLHCDPTMVLGLPGYEGKIERYKAYLRDLGRAGIGYTTYAHMANIKMRPYYMTGSATTRGGIPTREFDWSVAKSLPLSHGRIYNEDEIWRSFTNFVRAIIPVAEKARVRVGLHPDDPPVPSLGGVPRIFRNFEGYQRAIELADSENFGICFCVGTWAEGGSTMGKDVYEMIRYFGPRGRIFKVHFRNVDAPLPKFHETLVDDGYVDMGRVMKMLTEVKFQGVMIPDHVPGDGLRGVTTAYTIGYMRALREQAKAG